LKKIVRLDDHNDIQKKAIAHFMSEYAVVSQEIALMLFETGVMKVL
jgi:hypothetical protein